MYKEPESTRKKPNVDLSFRLPARVEILARDTLSSSPPLVTCTDGIGGLRGRKGLPLSAANNAYGFAVPECSQSFIAVVSDIGMLQLWKKPCAKAREQPPQAIRCDLTSMPPGLVSNATELSIFTGWD